MVGAVKKMIGRSSAAAKWLARFQYKKKQDFSAVLNFCNR